MTDRANHHLVPQFYFRNFTGGGRQINLLQKAKDRIILHAPIRGQCAKHGFYGPKQFEELLSKLESRHSIAIRDTLFSASQPRFQLTALTLSHLWEAVLLQRARAEIELEKHFPATEGILLEAFKEYLRITPGIEDRDEIIHVIEQGHCRIEEEPFASAWRHITVTLENVLLISDLDLHVVRNYSGVPFLFGDAPVVFCNTYYQNVKSRGVLGLQTPGLQIFFPLDSWTLLLFLDQKVYSGPFANGPIIDLISKCDVSQLNALQLHHSLNAVYFADASAKGYVEELWRAHRPTVVPLRSPFRILTDALVDGKPADCVYHSFEPKINFRLSLSFIDCTPIAESDYKWARRSPELVEEQKRRDAREFGEEDNPDATDLDGHVSPGSDFYF